MNVTTRRIGESIRTLRTLKRTFFASSTDHTTLLSNATPHCILQDDSNPYGPRTYILVPDGTTLDLAKKVDKLHLARLSADGNMIFHAKVVQRSLGSHAQVCKTLLSLALKDATSGGKVAQASACLDGLSKAVSDAIHEEEQGLNDSSGNITSILSKLKLNDIDSYNAVKSIATVKPREGHSAYRDGEQGWRELAEEYVSSGMSSEAQLYISNGAKLIGIEHLADTSREGLIDAGGSVAKLQF